MFDELIAGNIPGPETLAQMLTLVPPREITEPEQRLPVAWGVFRPGIATRRNYSHGGGGYDLDASDFGHAARSRVGRGVVSSSVGPRARDATSTPRGCSTGRHPSPVDRS